MSEETTDPQIERAHARIVNRLGLHARAAAKFVSTAERFSSEIDVARAGQSVSARSIMGLMMLGAACGEDITLEARGPDAQDAIRGLLALLADGFGEHD